MAADLIRYDLLVQDALRGVVRKVLGDMARDGLAGEHHFYITFRTHARGVRLSARMRELYPEEMTIILQHQFWDLSVTDHAFEVGLSFKNVPEMLLVPFEAVTRFSDPAAGFDLEFKLDADALEASANDAGSPAAAPPSAIETTKFKDRDFPPGAGPNPTEAPQPPEGGDKIVSIDAFRKKT
jgi:uncharacterized protein